MNQDELRNSIVPKMEVITPSTLELTDHMLPIIKDWKVGGRYFVRLEVVSVKQNMGDSFDPNDTTEFKALFKVVNAQALDSGNNVVDVQRDIANKTLNSAYREG